MVKQILLLEYNNSHYFHCEQSFNQLKLHLHIENRHFLFLFQGHYIYISIFALGSVLFLTIKITT